MGKNFSCGPKSVRMYLRGQGKIGYITGDKEIPDQTDPRYAVWDAENSMVMTWIVNSMSEKIQRNYMYFPTAKKLWDNITEMYSDLGNQSQVYELKLKLRSICQGGDSVTDYIHTLKFFWQDLDLYDTYEWKSTEDWTHYQKELENDRIYDFLAGLNDVFDEVRSRILVDATESLQLLWTKGTELSVAYV